MAEKKIKGRLVNLSQLAENYGVHRNTLSAWIKRGLPYVTKADRKKGLEWQFDTAEVAQWRESLAAESVQGDGGAINWEGLKMRADAEIAQVKAAKAKSEVATLEEIERQYIELAHDIKTRFRQIPSRAAPQLLGVQTEKEIKEILLDEIDEVLQALANEQ